MVTVRDAGGIGQDSAELACQAAQCGFGLGASLSFEQLRDFRIAGLLGKQLERSPLGVTNSTKTGETLQESRNPIDIASTYCVGEVIQFNSEEPAQLPQIFDCPACRGRAVLAISRIDLRAVLH